MRSIVTSGSDLTWQPQHRKPSPRITKQLGFSQNNLREYGLLISAVMIMVFFQVMTDGTLFSTLNLTNLILQNSYHHRHGAGMLLVIVAGHIDLSVGSVSGFIGGWPRADGWNTKYTLFRPPSSACGGRRHRRRARLLVASTRYRLLSVTLAGMLVFKGLALADASGLIGRPVPG